VLKAFEGEAGGGGRFAVDEALISAINGLLKVIC
jgi:hypothetical protein